MKKKPDDYNSLKKNVVSNIFYYSLNYPFLHYHSVLSLYTEPFLVTSKAIFLFLYPGSLQFFYLIPAI